jgi:DNA-binding HxlR family transcriptional regulator
MQTNKLRYSDCPMHRSMAILGTKWKPIVVWVLRNRTARFGQIAAVIETISRKVLTTTLLELEADGIIYREEFKEIPRRVEYSLTPRGLGLLPILQQLAEWDGYSCSEEPERAIAVLA